MSRLARRKRLFTGNHGHPSGGGGGHEFSVYFVNV